MINGLSLNEVLSSADGYLSPGLKAVGRFKNSENLYRIGTGLGALNGANIALNQAWNLCAPHIKPNEVHTKPSLPMALVGVGYFAGHIAAASPENKVAAVGQTIIAFTSFVKNHLVREPEMYYPPTSILPSYTRNDPTGTPESHAQATDASPVSPSVESRIPESRLSETLGSAAREESVGATSEAGHASGDTLHGRFASPTYASPAPPMLTVAAAAAIGGPRRNRSSSLPTMEKPPGVATGRPQKNAANPAIRPWTAPATHSSRGPART